MNIDEIKKTIESGGLDGKLKELYVDADMIFAQRKRFLGSLAQFEKNFSSKDVSIFSSPGRSEISGNHTDHQHGMAVAAAVNMDVLCVAAKNSSHTVCVISEGYEPFRIDSRNLEIVKQEEGTTVALIKGILSGMKENGFEIGGFDCYMTSSVLQGSGLSSSAAFENAIGTIVNYFFNGGKIHPTEIAKISKFAENVYFGKPSGLLDQIASSTGGLITIDFKDPENPLVKKIDVDFERFGSTLCIVDTKGSHAELTDEYAAIPKEMKTVASFFKKTHLRNVDSSDFYENIAELRKTCSDRAILRAIHFFTEEENVSHISDCLEKNDFEGFLHFIKKSGNSSFKFLQNIYSTKHPEIQNISLALALSEHLLEDGNGVARVHGGGFAGTIQAFVRNDFVPTYRENIEAVFDKGSCHTLKIRPCGSVNVI